MVKHIFLREVLLAIKKVDEKGNAIPFDIEFRTYNHNNKMGGVLKSYTGAKLLIGKKLKGEKFELTTNVFREQRVRKNPNHWQNKTRNIELESGHIRKINILYITKFNDEQVIY